MMTPEYARAPFLAWLKGLFGVFNDYELADCLDVSRSLISQIRSSKNPIGPILILAIHEKKGIPVADIRAKIKGA